MAVRRPAAWEFVAVVAAAAGLVLLAGLSWEAGQSALPPPPTAQPLRRPPPRGPPELYPSSVPLLDLPAVSLVANTVCGSEPLLLVILVISHPANIALRDAHRAQVSWEALDALGARRVFVMADGSGAGQPDYPRVEAAQVLGEAGRHRDLVVANFLEHYRNLTYKHALALTWASAYCPVASFVLKMDDDIMVDVWGVAALLRGGPSVDRVGEVGVEPGGQLLTSAGSWVAGLVQRGLLPQRRGGKWQVTEAEYPGRVYPDFLAGWAYLATQPAAAALLRAAASVPLFWIDDVHMTGTVAAVAGVPRYSLGRHYSLLAGAAACCLQGPRRGGRSPHPYFAPLCGLLVAPSDKNMTVLTEWLGAARACHAGRECPSTTAASCSATRPQRVVGTVIQLS